MPAPDDCYARLLGLIPCLSFLRREFLETRRDLSLGGACLVLARLLLLRLGTFSVSVRARDFCHGAIDGE